MTYARLQAKADELPLSALLQETAQAHFLRALPPKEMLPVLFGRRDLSRRLLTQVSNEAMHTGHCDAASLLMMDHCRTLLEAELAWLDRTIASLRSREIGSESE